MSLTAEEIQALEGAVLAGNSNPQFVGHLLSDLARKLMGASISSSPDGSTTEATSALLHILQHIQGFSPHDLREAMRVAVGSLTVDSARDSTIEAAQAGTRYLLAKSSGDGFSAARASKALSSFESLMRSALGERR